MPTVQGIVLDEGTRDGVESEGDFFATNWTPFPPSDVEACAEAFKALESAGIPGSPAYGGSRWRGDGRVLCSNTRAGGR